jgi:hypothetical protein
VVVAVAQIMQRLEPQVLEVVTVLEDQPTELLGQPTRVAVVAGRVVVEQVSRAAQAAPALSSSKSPTTTSPYSLAV